MNIELIIINSIIKNIIIDELYKIILIKNEFLKKRRKFKIIISKLRIINLIIIQSII